MLRGIRSRVLDVSDVKADTMLRFTILHRQIYGYWKVAREEYVIDQTVEKDRGI